ncbi:MAG TPA: type VI secretion system contractile sheath large subunit [Burkholderiaceae bacterium]|jgi:type VI secretion system protein ImpC
MSTDWNPNFGGISRTPPTWNTKRPLRIAVLGDFGAGALSGRMDTGAALAKRKPRPVEFDSLEDALARAQLKLQLPLGPDGAPIEIEISELESFHPDELYRNVELFSALSSLRKRLNTPSTFAAASNELKAWADDTGRPISQIAMKSPSRGATPSKGSTLDDFARLTGRPARVEVAEAGMQEFLRHVLGPFIQPAANPNKDAYIAHVDDALSDTMRALLHHADFQNLESLWRGADFLLRRLETSHALQVHLIDISAEELAADLSSTDDLAETGLYKLLVEQPGQDADGGYSYIAGCYHFDATPPHTELLGRAARVAAHAGAPFLTGMSTDPFVDRREPPHRLVREAFEALRNMPDASYLGLLGPRFMLRNQYGKKSEPISSFAFEEFQRKAGLRGMLWGHPALLALCVLAVRGGQLAIDDVPFHYYRDDQGDTVALPSTDRLISTDAANLLRTFGINSVMAYKGEARVRLAGLEAINGDGLASSTAAPRKAASDSRADVGTSASQRVQTDWTPAARGAGNVVVSSAAVRLAENEDTPAEETATSEDTAAAPAEAAEAAVDDELAALLASLDDTPAPEPTAEAGADAPAEAAAEEPAMDPELEALLKQLG